MPFQISTIYNNLQELSLAYTNMSISGWDVLKGSSWQVSMSYQQSHSSPHKALPSLHYGVCSQAPIDFPATAKLADRS